LKKSGAKNFSDFGLRALAEPTPKAQIQKVFLVLFLQKRTAFLA
jgi:hypothetical protein